MLPAIVKRKRPRKRLSLADSERLMMYVRRLLPRREYGRTRKLSAIFGCAERTATRLLNCAPDKFPALRRAYLDSTVKYTGLPASVILQLATEDPEIKRKLNRALSDKLPQFDRLKAATDLASSMAARCMFNHGMPAKFSVECDERMFPMAIGLIFNKVESPGVKYEVRISRNPELKWQMVFGRLGRSPLMRSLPSDVYFERMLKTVNNL